MLNVLFGSMLAGGLLLAVISMAALAGLGAAHLAKRGRR